MIATGEISKVQEKKTAFEQPAIFEFICHLPIKRREGAHEVLLSSSGYTPSLVMAQPDAPKRHFGCAMIFPVMFG